MTTLADKLGALHVWPQHVADNYADTLTRKEIEKLYEVGNVAEEALRALRERDQAVEALLDVGASLAAAISLLERSRKSAMKAAPSNLMFDQMLADYRASLSRARTTLASIEGTGHE